MYFVYFVTCDMMMMIMIIIHILRHVELNTVKPNRFFSGKNPFSYSAVAPARLEVNMLIRVNTGATVSNSLRGNTNIN